MAAMDGRSEPPVVALEMAHSVSAVRVRPGRGPRQYNAWCSQFETGEWLTFTLWSVLAHFANKFRDRDPVTSTTGIIELLDVVGGFGLLGGNEAS